MMKSTFNFTYSTRQHLKIFLLYSLIALALLAPAGSNTYIPVGQDAVPHFLAIKQAKMAIEEGQFPIRTMPEERDGWGYAHFQFYGSSIYTIAGLLSLYVFPENPYIAYKVMLFFSFLFGGFFLYRVANQLIKNNASACLSGVAYMVSPYFLIDAHARSAFAETMALGLIPIILYYSYQLYSEERFSFKNLVLSALGWYLLMTTHLVTFANTSLFIGLFFILSGWQKKHFFRLMRVGLSYGLACLIGAWFLVPVFLVSPLLKIQRAISTDILMDTNALTTLPRLLSPVSMTPASPHVWQELELLFPFYPGIGWPVLMSVVGCIYAVFAKKDLESKQPIIQLLIVFLLAFFMTWSPVNFWQYLPKELVISQFSYRYLSQVMWIGALLLGFASVNVLKSLEHLKLPSWLYMAFGLWVIVLSNASWLMVNYESAFYFRSPMLKMYSILRGVGIDYLIDPEKIHEKMLLNPAIPVEKIKSYCQRNSLTLNCRLPNSFKGGVIAFPALYYPKLLQVSVNYHDMNYSAIAIPGNVMLVSLKLPPGHQRVIIEFIGIYWANEVSCVTLFLLLFIYVLRYYRYSRFLQWPW